MKTAHSKRDYRTRMEGSNPSFSAIAFNFAADGRGGALQASGNTTQRHAALETSGYLFTLDQRQG
jgi:hypothetical protein